jgi:hypothetical protein
MMSSSSFKKKKMKNNPSTHSLIDLSPALPPPLVPTGAAAATATGG